MARQKRPGPRRLSRRRRDDALKARAAENSDVAIAPEDVVVELDEDVVEPEDALPEITFDELPSALQEASARAGWSTLMPVQAKAIPYMLAGRDLMIQSRTGSGKTGAFLLPIIDRLDPGDRARADA